MKKVLMKKVLMKKVLCKSSTGKMLKYKIYVSIHSKVRLDQVRLSSPCNNSFLSVFNLLHKTFYNFLNQYIHFLNEDDTDYKLPVKGQGRRNPVDKVEIIPSIEPAMLFNDVKMTPAL